MKSGTTESILAGPFIIACLIVGAVVMNLTLPVNHRKDRYIAM